MKKVKISVPQLLIEFISVVFAVLLALGLNSYKQSRDTQKEAEALKLAILSECKKNLDKIDSVVINNKEYEEFLDSLVRLPDEQITNYYFSYSYQMLTSGAWLITQNSESANSIDQEFLLDAADIYQTQQFFDDFSSRFFQNMGMMIANMDEERNPEMARSIYFNVNVMNSSALGLKKEYEKFIAKYDKP